jgi:hypothetical protein
MAKPSLLPVSRPLCIQAEKQRAAQLAWCPVHTPFFSAS